MSIGYVTLTMLGALTGMMIMGLPLAFVTMTIAIVMTWLVLGVDGLPLVTTRIFTFVTEYALVAVPMFVLMAGIMERSGVARDMYNAMKVWAGRLRGGVGIQTMVVAVFLAAITGIVGGETVMLGMVALPQLLRLGYDKKLASGAIASGGALGTMIPPSIVLIMYGLTAGVSVGDLFVATTVPGLLLSGLYMAYIAIVCHRRPELGPALPPEEVLPLKEKIRHLKKVVAPALIAFWVLGSIYAGIASVTEAAGVGCVASMLVAFKRGVLSRKMLMEVLMQTMETCGKLFWLSFGATALIGTYNIMGGSRYLTDLITGLPLPPIGIILIMMVILIILGLFMDWIGILLLTMPIFIPIILKLGYDPIWFGVLFCMNMQISFISPPFGPACFYLNSVAPPEVSLTDIFRGVIPFICLQIVALLLVLFNPQIALWFLQFIRG